jgi:alanine dehydrogenase
MIIGLLKEIKNHEYRVGLLPASVQELINHGHDVLVETGVGLGIDFSDSDYRLAGAKIFTSAEEIFNRAELIIKVKEPQASECALLRPGQLLFTYLHLAADKKQTKALIDSGAICIAYETVTSDNGGLPLLAPMSAVAGRMAVQAGAQALEKSNGGAGMLLGGVPGVESAKVVILGGGIVGNNAAQIALGMGADVVILDKNNRILRKVDTQFSQKVKTVYSTAESLQKYIVSADLVIGSVLIPGAAAPKLITREHIKKMKKGAVIVDVAIDQGGCTETSQPTTHEHPTFIVDGVVHYCVTNMPGAVPKTSTMALTNATLPFIIELANKGYIKAFKENKHLLNGLNIFEGHVTCENVALNQKLTYQSPLPLLSDK